MQPLRELSSNFGTSTLISPFDHIYKKNSVVEIKLAYRHQLEAGMLVCECGSAPLGNLESNIEPHGSVRSASRHLSHTQGWRRSFSTLATVPNRLTLQCLRPCRSLRKIRRY